MTAVPARRRTRGPEEQLQLTQIDLLRKLVPPPPSGPVWTAINPIPSKSKAAAGMSKALGLRAGWPDLVLHWRGETIYIENKAPKKGPRPEQRQVHDELRAHGAIVYPKCQTIAEFIDILDRHDIPHRIDRRYFPPGS